MDPSGTPVDPGQRPPTRPVPVSASCRTDDPPPPTARPLRLSLRSAVPGGGRIVAAAVVAILMVGAGFGAGRVTADDEPADAVTPTTP